MKSIKAPILFVVSLLFIAGVAVLLLVRQMNEAESSRASSVVSVVRGVGGQGDGSAVEQAARRKLDASRASVSRALPSRSDSLESVSMLLDSIGATPPAGALASLRTETDYRFSSFLASLEGSPQRIEDIRRSLVAAYADILAFGVAVQQGDINDLEAQARTDPNYVLNQMASQLSPDELTSLENFMEADARLRFQSTYGPQLKVVGSELTVGNSERLLETLFLETYLLVNENGIGAASNLEASFQRQLEAIENTRDSLRLSMTPQQYEEADKFLTEQESGLLGAQTIFSAN